MRTAHFHFHGLTVACRSFWHKFMAGSASSRDCVHLRSVWRRLHFRREMPGVLLNGSRYCRDECLEHVLSDVLERVRSPRKRATASHRIPLGLLLIARQQLTAEQLRAALEAQQSAGHGRIGEWLLSLGFVTEEKLTAALARQWSCPVLRPTSTLRLGRRSPQLPLALLEGFAMIPVDYVEASSTLHVAFGGSLDHSLLYAIEKMSACRTEACMAPASFVSTSLERRFEHRSEYEVTFDCLADTAQCCRIVGSYCARLSASEIRVAACGTYVWVRLFRASRAPMDLLFRSTTAPAARQVDRRLTPRHILPTAAAVS